MNKPLISFLKYFFKKLRPKIGLAVVSLLAVLQSCQPKEIDCLLEGIELQNSNIPKNINWNQFPAFNLPFKIVYGGPKIYQSQSEVLNHGFSHIELLSATNSQALPIQNRAALWYLVAFPFANQPWEVHRSPWGNNKTLYENHWQNAINNFSLAFNGSTAGTPNVDLFVFDIERQQKSNDSILVLKNLSSTPSNFKTLENDAFINQYKKDLQALYNEPIRAFKNRGKNPTTKLSSYGDSPILNTFSNITGNSWADWTTRNELLNYLNQDLSTKKLGGEFYENQDVVMPSAYFYNDYPSPLAADYLGYMLFQVEVNKAITNKPIIPFVWMKFSGGLNNTNQNPKFIQPYMAEASAIFPFMAGAKGLWLWENPSTFNENINYKTYEHFINGLYRLSQHKEMFDDNPVFYAETNARDLVNDRKPVWRAVVNKNKILIAASNPYASEAEETSMTIKYKTWKKKIILKGREVVLCKHDL